MSTQSRDIQSSVVWRRSGRGGSACLLAQVEAAEPVRSLDNQQSMTRPFRTVAQRTTTDVVSLAYRLDRPCGLRFRQNTAGTALLNRRAVGVRSGLSAVELSAGLRAFGKQYCKWKTGRKYWSGKTVPLGAIVKIHNKRKYEKWGHCAVALIQGGWIPGSTVRRIWCPWTGSPPREAPYSPTGEHHVRTPAERRVDAAYHRLSSRYSIRPVPKADREKCVEESRSS